MQNFTTELPVQLVTLVDDYWWIGNLPWLAKFAHVMPVIHVFASD